MIRRPPRSTLFPYTTLFRSPYAQQQAIAIGPISSVTGTVVVGRGVSTPIAITVEERSEEHTSELQSRLHLVCRLLLEKKKKHKRRQSELAYESDVYEIQSVV